MKIFRRSRPVRRLALDRFSAYLGTLSLQGWSDRGRPTVLYEGKPVRRQATHLQHRPDLPALLGPGSDRWGFWGAAHIPDQRFDPDKVALKFGSCIVENPGRFAARAEDQAQGTMLAEFISATGAGGRMLEIGSRARSGNTYRTLFARSIEHVGLDIAPGPCVDVVGDAHELSKHAPGRFDFVFSVSVFEHLLMPWKVALEMNKVMKPGALAFIQSHGAWPLHEEPWDYLRFSKEAWRGLFNAHTGFEVVQSEQAMRCRIVAELANTPVAVGMDGSHHYLCSACLVRRTHDAQVRWEAPVSAIADLDYDHGT